MPEGSIPVTCPASYWFNVRVGADHNNTRYWFVLKTGAKTTQAGPTSGTAYYTFGDVISTAGGAKLINAWMLVACNRVYDVGSSTLYIQQLMNGASALQIIHAPPTTSSGPMPVSQSETFQTYCLFRNYYDANWNFLYNEQIPGSCWTIQLT
jgi:hypothetical protein